MIFVVASIRSHLDRLLLQRLFLSHGLSSVFQEQQDTAILTSAFGGLAVVHLLQRLIEVQIDSASADGVVEEVPV